MMSMYQSPTYNTGNFGVPNHICKGISLELPTVKSDPPEPLIISNRSTSPLAVKPRVDSALSSNFNSPSNY